jgi:hypothetical protein
MCKNVASSVMVMRGGRREVVAWDLAWDIHGDGACGASWGVWNLDKRRLLYLLVLEVQYNTRTRDVVLCALLF